MCHTSVTAFWLSSSFYLLAMLDLGGPLIFRCDVLVTNKSLWYGGWQLLYCQTTECQVQVRMFMILSCVLFGIGIAINTTAPTNIYELLVKLRHQCNLRVKILNMTCMFLWHFYLNDHMHWQRRSILYALDIKTLMNLNLSGCTDLSNKLFQHINGKNCQNFCSIYTAHELYIHLWLTSSLRTPGKECVWEVPGKSDLPAVWCPRMLISIYSVTAELEIPNSMTIITHCHNAICLFCCIQMCTTWPHHTHMFANVPQMLLRYVDVIFLESHSSWTHPCIVLLWHVVRSIQTVDVFLLSKF